MSKYTGGRIVPKHCGTWSSANEYETLSVVLYAATGDSYMSRKAVPAGIKITDTEYWAKSADYSSKISTMEQMIASVEVEAEKLKAQIAENVSASTDTDADYAAEIADARVDNDGSNYSSLGEHVRTIDSEIVEMCQMDDTKLDMIHSKNLFNADAALTSGYLNYRGSISTSDDFFTSDYIIVQSLTTYHVSALKSGPYFCFYTRKKELISIISNEDLIGDYGNTFTTPENCYYVRFSVYSKNLSQTQLEEGEEETDYEEYTDYLPIQKAEKRLDAAEERLDVLEAIDLTDDTKLDKVYGKNLFNANAELTSGYLNYRGNIAAADDFCTSDYTLVEPETVYHVNVLKSGPYLCFYTKEKELISLIANNALMGDYNNTFTTPENCYYVRFSIYSKSISQTQLEEGEEETDYEEYTDYLPIKKVEERLDAAEERLDSNEERLEELEVFTDPSQIAIMQSATVRGTGISATADTLLSNESIELTENSIKKNKHLSFSAEINEFNGIAIGHGRTLPHGNYITIDSENVNVYAYGTTAASLLNTVTHGLTISDFIKIVIDCAEDNTAKLIIFTLSGVYSMDCSSWNGSSGAVFVESNESELTNVKLSWTCDDYKCPIWLFGDSYVTHGASNRWPYYLKKWGFFNWLENSFPGEGSNAALADLKDALQYGTPRYLIWCIGQNNPDTNTAVNSSWLSAMQSIVSICQEKGIELILSTVPNVRGTYDESTDSYNTRYHNYKNAWVKESGYRYIDFARAVNADESGTIEWYSGMLTLTDSDGVHPTSLGAQTLALQVLVDFPEIMQRSE